MQKLYLLFIVLSLAGCTRVYSVVSPNDNPRFLISAPSSQAAIEKANELCPRGYEFVAAPKKQGGDIESVIECRKPKN